MFKYYNLAFKNAKPQNLKAILFTLISFIVIFLVGRVAMAMIGQQMMQLQMMMQFGQPAGPLLIPIIGVAVLVILLFIFLGYQLLTGAINVISRAIRKDKVKFSDLFIAFKKGHYAKSLLLALITIVLFIIIGLINYYLRKLLLLAMSPLNNLIMSNIDLNDHQGLAVTYQIVFSLIISFILSIFSWLFLIFIINYTAAYVENPKQSAMTSFKNGFKAIKNGHKTWLKFFISVLLILLVLNFITNLITALMLLYSNSISQSVAQIILIIINIIVILVTLFIYYALLMGIVQYFIRRGEKVTTNSKKNKANKAVANKDTNNKTTKTQDLQDTTKDKVDQHSSDLKDNAKSTTQDSKKELNDKATQHKDDLSNSTTSHKDNLEETAKDTIDKNNPNNK
ncbi:YtxH domain-containing protein [Staphylococcus pasteuri]|uniref:lytic transglycosylase n=1 Tax=Staphylococcus TaxID=1279 RepID=UPI00048FF590|nr:MULTISPECIES: lytic transglycosylase [Staphylococcus]MBL3399444.1 YtxH domain-containing protein [Staphylococcus pasteuri]RNM17208.1 YtxH domain-containing protein [Staphylococcus pasteuri]